MIHLFVFFTCPSLQKYNFSFMFHRKYFIYPTRPPPFNLLNYGLIKLADSIILYSLQ